MQSASLGEPPGQCCDHRPIRPGHAWSSDLARQHGDFMTQHQDLGIFERELRASSPRHATSCRKIT